MFVLLTNDDGIHSEGLWAAAEELRQDRRVTRLEIIAPQVQQSGVSHSITYLSPLVPTRETVRGQSVWVVNGTPADCVKPFTIWHFTPAGKWSQPPVRTAR